MDASRLNEFREALRYLSFNGITLKEFAKKINVKPHTLYNYISGQKPSFKNYNYILKYFSFYWAYMPLPFFGRFFTF